eukprot:PhM_4_TR9210/c0_g1_i1/m.68980
MARDNIKKAYRASNERLALYRQVTYGINALWLVFTLFLSAEENGGGWGIGTWFGLGFWFGQQYLCEWALQFHFAPAFDAAGNILDCNDITDPLMLGSFSYAQDALWICWATQVLTLVSRWFYVLYAVVPGFALYKGLSLALPFVFQFIFTKDGDAAATPGAGGSARDRLKQKRQEAGKRRF